jgi:two-component system, chemotaxis family, chemotaxis protein CheY
MGRCIMVVEDLEDVRWTTCSVLRAAGYEVVEAVNGKEALAMFDDEQVDAIVTDLNMPELDGIGVVKGVRAHPTRAFVPIVMVTSLVDSSRIEEGNMAGVTTWVFKPYRPNRLLAALEKVLS